MDVILEVQGRNSFSITVEPFDIVRDVKEKVQNFYHIPISHQTFIFNGQLLHDDLHVWGTPIDGGSRIQLIIAAVDPDADATSLVPPTPMPEPQPPRLPSYGYDPLGMPEFPASLQLNPMPYDYDPFGFEIPEFSSSTQVTEMPQMPSNRNELKESLPSADTWASPLQMLLMPSAGVTLNAKMPKSKDRIPIEMELKDTVLKLKEKIVEREEMQGVPVEKIVLHSHSARVELLDHQILEESAVSMDHEIDVFMKPRHPVADGSGASGSGSGKGKGKVKVKVKVLPMRTREKIEIEVNDVDKVSVLRQQLEKLQQTLGFRLPENGAYFFIHRQRVMYEEESFQWHRVREGDTIETFDGFVTAAPPKLRGKRR